MATIKGKLKTKSGDVMYPETSADKVVGLGAQVIVLEDNGTTTAGTWLAKTDRISSLEEGQLFLYEVTKAGASTTTLNITGSAGTALGAKTIYRYGTTKLTTQYPVGTRILLCYNGSAFTVVNDYDANSDTKVRQYQSGSGSTSGNKYALLSRYTQTDKSGTYEATYTRYHTEVTLDTSDGTLDAPTLSEDGTPLEEKYYLASNPNGYTSNEGTITGITMNGKSKGTSGIVDLGTVIVDVSDKADLVNGKVPSSQLPSYVDDVLECDKKADFPATGEAGKIYVDKATNLAYRWGGSAYVEISPSLALGETASTAFAGNRGVALETAVGNLKAVATSGSYNDLSDKPIFWATYGTTTYEQITDAVSAGQLPVTKYNGITYTYSKDWGSSLGHVFGTMDANFDRWVYCKQNSTWGTGYMEVENSVNKTNALTSDSTVTQYPNAKVVYDTFQLYAKTTDIPTVNNGTLTIQGNGTAASTFTANQSGNTTLNIRGSGKTTVTKSADNEITISSNADNGNADKVDGMHMLDQTYAYMGYLDISIGCVNAVVNRGLTEAQIFALTGNLYGKLYLASDTGKYWRRKNTQTAASADNWRDDTATANASLALPNQLSTTEDAVYVRLNVNQKYYNKLPKFFVEANYDNVSGSTQITGFCRRQNDFEITSCNYNGNNLKGIYQESANTDQYIFKFAKFRSNYGASSQLTITPRIYYNEASGTPTVTFIGSNHADYNKVKAYSYCAVPDFGIKGTAIYDTMLPRANDVNLGSASNPWNKVYGTTLYENGTSLASKYQAKLPTTSTAGKVLKSTSAEGTVEWGSDNLVTTDTNQTIDGQKTFTNSAGVVVGSKSESGSVAHDAYTVTKADKFSIYEGGTFSGNDDLLPTNYGRTSIGYCLTHPMDAYTLTFPAKSGTIATTADIVADTNQKVKTGSVTFGDDDVVSFVQDGATTITGDASAKTITISSPSVNNGTLTIKANGTQKGTFSANQSSNATIDITAADLGLSSAMKFIGETSGLSDGSTTNPVTIGGNSVTATAGNVVLCGNKEFVWTGSAWEELGDGSSYALNSVTITATGALAGGGTLANSREITHNKVLGSAKAAGVYKIALDEYGHVSSATAATLNDLDNDCNYAVTNADNNFSSDQTFKNITLYSASGDSPRLTFQRGTLTDGYNDWSIYDSGGYLHIQERGNGSSSWGSRVTITQTGANFNGTLTENSKAVATQEWVGNNYQGKLPTTSTAGKVLKSTSTAGTVEWGDAPATGVTDVKIGNSSIVDGGVATMQTNSAYNATTNKIATMSDIPTKVSDLTNDSGFVQSNSLATVATSGSYNDLIDKPSSEKIDVRVNNDHIKGTNSWVSKTWTGLTSFSGKDIWTDGTHTYYSNGNDHYEFVDGSWVAKAWTGLTSFFGEYIWTDGIHIYSSNYSIQYELVNGSWVIKSWTGLTNFSGDNVWTDGTHTYYSNDSNQYELVDGSWVAKTWTGLTSFSGKDIWTDGVSIYYSGSSAQFRLVDGIWTTKTWTVLTGFYGRYIWTDGTHIYYSNGSNQYELVVKTSQWFAKTWTGLTSFFGGFVWTDGIHIYHSLNSKHHELKRPYGDILSLAAVATTGSYNDLTNKPTIPGEQVQSNWTETNPSLKSYIKNKPSLATVATSGSYNDLTNKPTLATVATTGSYNDLTNKPTIQSTIEIVDLRSLSNA